MRHRTAIILLLASTLGFVATAADGHARLQTSIPAAGATLKMAPKEIRLRFSEGLVAGFSGLTLTDGQGKLVLTGQPVLGDNTNLIVPIAAPLKPGAYSVAWHAVSVDTHRISGKFKFEINR